MPVLAVKIENEASLLMNEFFDYNGSCFAISRSRLAGAEACIALEDFYECTVQTEVLKDIPVVFVADGKIAGWYKRAAIYRRLQRISVFLEGNICAKVTDVCLLPKAGRIGGTEFNFKEKLYEVIESGDVRFESLMEMMANAAVSLNIAYTKADSFFSGDRLRLTGAQYKNDMKRAASAKAAYCIERCSETARRVMGDGCSDIRELKTMYDYAKQALIYDRKSVDALYYLAMACEQLGFIKEGIKAIEKALEKEPDGDDLLVLKGHILYALEKYDEAEGCYKEALEICPDDGYRMCLGNVQFVSGNVDAAYKTYKSVEDKSLLDMAGINLKAMEKRWPFVAVRGFSLKDFFKSRRNKEEN